VVEQPESRSPLSVGLEWVTMVTTIGLEFALPPVIGYFIDARVGTAPVGTIVGAVVGFLVGMLHIVRMSRSLPDGSRRGTGGPSGARGRTPGPGDSDSPGTR